MFFTLSKQLFLGLFGLSFIQISTFTVWGYAAIAAAYPWAIAYVSLLTVSAALALVTVKKADRWPAASSLGVAIILTLSMLGGYLHPSDELRAAMVAR